MLVLGDFNTHADPPDCSLSTGLVDVLDNFGLQQQVDFAIHNKGHTLDLLCTTGVDLDKLEGTVSRLSDHKLTIHLHPRYSSTHSA